MTNVWDLFDQKDEDKKEFEQLPSGSYQAEIEEAKIDETGKFGPMLKYTLKVTESTKFKNRKLWVNRKLDSATFWKVRKDLDALGFKDVSSKNAKDVVESLPGKIVNIELSYSPNKTNPEKPWQNLEFVGSDDLPF